MSGPEDFDHQPEGTQVEGAAPGERLGGYRLVRFVGAGGMGVVWEAWDETLKRRVALKVLGGAARGPQALERFRQEATLAARLRHPNIVVVHEAGDDRGRAYIAMEFVEGRTLEQEIDARLGEAAHLEGPAREAARREAVRGLDRAGMRRVASIARDVARALHAGHVHTAPGADAPTPIVHRDVKPGNVVVDATGAAKLLDYGLAKETGVALTVTREALGTPLYMSPEQLFSARRVGPRSDIYSLGMTLQACLTLARPFEESQPGRLFEHILRHDPRDVQELHPGVPAELATIIRTATAKDERSRYPTAAALAEDLEAWLEGRPIVARPPGRLARLQQRARRRPVLFVGGPLLAFVTATGWLAGELYTERLLQDAAELAEYQAQEATTTRERERQRAGTLFDEAGMLFSLAAQARAAGEPDERWLAILNTGTLRERDALGAIARTGEGMPPALERRALLARRARGDAEAEAQVARLLARGRQARSRLVELRPLLERLRRWDSERLGRALLAADGQPLRPGDEALVDPDVQVALTELRPSRPKRYLDATSATGATVVGTSVVSHLTRDADRLAPEVATLADLERDRTGPVRRQTLRVVAGPGCGSLEGLRVVVLRGKSELARGAPGDALSVEAPASVVVEVEDPASGRATRVPLELARPVWGVPPVTLRVALPARPQDGPPGAVLLWSPGAAPLWVDQREVSGAEYGAFVAAVTASDHATCPADEAAAFPAGKDHAPARQGDPASAATGLDWWDARAYAAWRGARLPTATEWALAAGAADGLPDLAGANLCGVDDGALWGDGAAGHLAPCGARDLVGGVAEWLAGDDGTRYREAGGGSWATRLPAASGAVRLVERFEPVARGGDLGLRCVVDLPPVPPASPTPPRVRWPRDGRDMLHVEAGEVELRQAPPGAPSRGPDALVLVSSFLVDASPVTNAEVAAWVAALTVADDPRRLSLARTLEQARAHRGPEAPAELSWEEAAAYAAWAGKRLPTEAEWVAAVRRVIRADGASEWCQDSWFDDALRFLPRKDPLVTWPTDERVLRSSPARRHPGGPTHRARVRCVAELAAEEGR